jgi:predicted ATP-dependent serine protease
VENTIVTDLTGAAVGQGLARAPTGISGLDQIIGGGLPQGRVTLVAGSAGAGKTLLGLQFLLAGARQYGEPGVLLTFEESAAKADRLDETGRGHLGRIQAASERMAMLIDDRLQLSRVSRVQMKLTRSTCPPGPPPSPPSCSSATPAAGSASSSPTASG